MIERGRIVSLLIILSSIGISLQTEQDCFPTGTSIQIKWDTSGGTKSKPNSDWIGIYPNGACTSGTCPSGSTAWSYITITATSGTTSIMIPTTTPPGIYNAYYLLLSGAPYSVRAVSLSPSSFWIGVCNSTLSLSVSSTTPTQSMLVNATWTGVNPSDKNDYIGFFKSTSYSTTTLIHDAWVFTYGGQTSLDIGPPSSGTIAVPVPPETGTYYIAYCIQGGYSCYSPMVVTVGTTPDITVTCRRSPQTSIEHIVLVVPENHSFDSIFGRYCTATTGSKPKCNIGPTCCEAAPDKVDGVSPTFLDDSQNDNFDPSHSQDAMLCENNQGKLDKFISGCPGSSSPGNFAIASKSSVPSYYTYASQYAMSDTFFQSISGGSCANNMYFLSGKFLFTDNTMVPQNSSMSGSRCYSSGFMSYHQTTILDLLQHCGFSWKIYAEGWDKNPSMNQCYPSYFDSSDFAASYFPSLTQNPGANWRDFSKFTSEVNSRTLPTWSYVKGLGINSEHPGEGTLSSGANIINTVVNAVMNSDTYKRNTLIIWTPDESGGYYDHINPPGVSTIDGQPYGPRTPMVAIGYAVKNNFVSHVPMETSSIIKFVEWNWLGDTGQLGARDTVVANIGSLLDSTKTGVTVPDF